jgi:hypothetical protein
MKNKEITGEELRKYSKRKFHKWYNGLSKEKQDGYNIGLGFGFLVGCKETRRQIKLEIDEYKLENKTLIGKEVKKLLKYINK